MKATAKKPRKLISKILTGLVLLCVGAIIILIAAGMIGKYTRIQNNGVHTIAEVTEFAKVTRSTSGTRRSYFIPVVEFYAVTENKPFLAEINSKSLKIGQKVDIIYEESNPSSAVLASQHNFFDGIILPLLFLSPFIILHGLFSYFYYKSIFCSISKLHSNPNSVVIYADIIDVSQDEYDHDKWTIKAQWLNPKTNKMHRFESDGIAYNPKQYLSERIQVLIDPKTPKNYSVLLEGIPELA